MKEKQKMKALFIGGAGHSGTTMLANIFRAHEKSIGTYGESRVPESLQMIVKQYKGLNDKQGQLEFLETHSFYGISFKKVSYQYERKKKNPFASLLKASQITGDFHQDYYQLIDQALIANSSNFFVEKTPANVFHSEEVFRLVPEAKLLIIHRDVRDVVASLKKRYLTLLNDPEVYKHNLATKKLDKDYNLMMDALMWQKAVQASQKALGKYGSEKVKIVRYEDFVEKPEQNIREICVWIGIDFQEQMLALKARNSADQQLKKQKGITGSAVGKYALTLDKEEVAVVEKYARKGMRELGIPTSKVNVNKMKVLQYELTSYTKVIDRVRKRLMLMNPAYAWNFSKRVLKKLVN